MVNIDSKCSSAVIACFSLNRKTTSQINTHELGTTWYVVLVQGIVKENRIHNEDEMLNEE